MVEKELCPYLVNLKKIGSQNIGYISVIENATNLPFQIERVYWSYYTPEEVIRGKHAHYKTQQILIAVSGKIQVSTEMPDGQINQFILEQPNVGLFIPARCWHTMQYSHFSVQLVLADSFYNEDDYIREYQEFKKLTI